MAISERRELVADEELVMSREADDPEKTLLLLCARAHLDERAVSRMIALLEQPIDWERLTQLAREHWVTQPLYWHLKNVASEQVPPPVLEQLRNEFEGNLRRNLFLVGELRRILLLFKAKNIQALPFKGPTLAQDAYGNIALRAFSDIDVLIRKEDFLRVVELLSSIGYESLRPSVVQRRLEVLSRCESEFIDTSGAALVDVHWGIAESEALSTLDFPYLMKNTTSSSVLGLEVPVLSPEDSLLFCCVHGSNHLWYYLQGVGDVAEIIRVNARLDWGRIVEQADRLRIDRMLFVGLLLAHDLLDAAVPDYILERARGDKSVCSIAKETEKDMFKQQRSEPQALDMLSLLRIRRSWRDKLRELLRFGFVPTLPDYEALRLPPRFFTLYYVLHLARISIAYGPALITRAHRNSR